MLKSFVCVLLYSQLVAAVTYNYQGCYDSSSLRSMMSSLGTYTYQSISYCQTECNGSKFIALLDGGECYCSDDTSILDVLSSLQSDSSQCNVGCNGWPYQTCGGQTYMDFYVDSSITVVNSVSSSTSLSSAAASSSSTSVQGSTSAYIATTTISTTQDSTPTSSFTSTRSSSSQSSTTSIVSKLETTSTYESLSSSSSDSQAVLTSSSLISSPSTNNNSVHPSTVFTSTRVTTELLTTSVVTASDNGSQVLVYVTKTETFATTSAVASSNSISVNGKNSNSSSPNSLSSGDIAGIVIGVVFGTFFILAALIYANWRRKKHAKERDIEESKQHQPYSYGDVDANPIILPERAASSKFHKHPKYIGPATSDSEFFFSTYDTHETDSSPSSSRDLTSSSSSMNSGVNLISKEAIPIEALRDNQKMTNPKPIVRFSTTSIPFLVEDRQLRIVNPDDEKIEDQYKEDFDDSSRNN
ncbi:hypothetical protein TPHA_0P01140 [Tetrapisispora phaffii CBS 4417]|uniref:WSC domain-containing protein n=1 Tax=Tetrapisispora phaffii (strain ATCC 24235 / CBS 4417 / NBRC 1672 / NRRL Y-8282 / UCD 70-5) TaxID=1071381 RepID=G8C294_TETPH|nr:hypothetical protein TPHA_0P01140 [Tetrapisispora phaffii CBS 4417]CCE66272.1 hypothetical protein TPHA_0P01140 [Tetrapisispora phaffii CBS 4417]